MTDLELYDKITGAGLFACQDNEPYFSWSGCDYCRARTGKTLGNSVHDCKGFISLEDAKIDNDYEFKLCGGCLCAIANGDPWPEED